MIFLQIQPVASQKLARQGIQPPKSKERNSHEELQKSVDGQSSENECSIENTPENKPESVSENVPENVLDNYPKNVLNNKSGNATLKQEVEVEDDIDDVLASLLAKPSSVEDNSSTENQSSTSSLMIESDDEQIETTNPLNHIRMKALKSENTELKIENTKLKSDKILMKEILKDLQEKYKFGNEYLCLVDD